MATIALYSGRISQMPGLIKDVKTAVNNLKFDLSELQKKANKVDSSVCDLSDVISSIRSSTQVQEERVTELENFQTNSEDFIKDAVRIDESAAETVNQEKKNFYEKYSYLKPDCEKSFLEKVCDGLKDLGEWCKEHWKLIVTIVIVAVAIVLICTGVGGAIVLGAAWGALLGAGIGGLSGGLESMANGGSFLEGFENGAFSGAISGAIMGGAMAGLGALGATLGKGISCVSKLGKLVKVTAKVTSVLSKVMGSFDTLAMFDKTFGLFGGNLADFNAKLHESTAYNTFQIGVSALAALTNGMTSTMKCFVAGTLVLTACGLKAIESIQVGDKVYAADTESLTVSLKPVLETYVRQTSALVHISVNNEQIVSTYEHPFYVKGSGFIDAGNLWIGAELIDKQGNVHVVGEIKKDILGGATETVYNFKVADYHTYYIGNSSLLVHNAASYDVDAISKNMAERVPDDEIDPPSERGNAPISKKDGKPIEIHHDDQKPEGPFYEKTQTDHRLGKNYKLNHPHHNQNSKINRSQFKYQKQRYWENEWDRGRFK